MFQTGIIPVLETSTQADTGLYRRRVDPRRRYRRHSADRPESIDRARPRDTLEEGPCGGGRPWCGSSGSPAGRAAAGRA